MANLLHGLVTKRRHLVMEEENVMKVIKVLNNHKLYREISIGNCGWEDTSKWFIHFDASRKQWNSIVTELNVIRVWKYCNIPEDITGMVYSND